MSMSLKRLLLAFLRGLTRQLLLQILKELVSELVGADQCAGLCVACPRSISCPIAALGPLCHTHILFGGRERRQRAQWLD